MKLLRFILLLVLPTLLFSQSTPDYGLNKPLDAENLDRLDSMIKANAPEVHALKAMAQVANTFSRYSKNMNAYIWMQRYKSLFPNNEQEIQARLNQFSQFAITEYPDTTNRSLFLQYAKINAPSEDAYVSFLRYISEPINFGRWQQAIDEIKANATLFPNKEDYFTDIIEIMTRPTEGLYVTNLGTNINTAVSEWDPNLTADGEHLYFSGNNRGGGQGGDDVWVSDLVDGIWQKPRNLGRKVNGDRNETIDNISTDGNTLMLSGDFMGTFGNFDIYSIDREGDDWGGLFHYPYPINTEYVDEGGNITADRKAMIFTSDRPGGVGEFVPLNQVSHGSTMGNMDVYVSFQSDTGWSGPINLGGTINTPYAERSPYLHPDGKTLYFSSDGHPGLGGLDVYVSKRLDDTWTNWSKPINLGNEINTILNDWGYKVGISGDSAVFSGFARTNGYGQWDLYSITLPKGARPNPVVLISGLLKDSKGRKVEAEIVWEDLETGEILGTTKSNYTNGHYFIALPIGKNYGYYVKKNGYYPTSNSVDLTNAKDGQRKKVDIELISVNEIKNDKSSVVINNIFFDFDSANLHKESELELNRLVGFLKDNKIAKVTIVGHTDKVGEKTYNKKLSLDRANSVKKYISSKINNTTISTLGMGSDEPIDKTDDSKNRRVEIKVE